MRLFAKPIDPKANRLTPPQIHWGRANPLNLQIAQFRDVPIRCGHMSTFGRQPLGDCTSNPLCRGSHKRALSLKPA